MGCQFTYEGWTPEFRRRQSERIKQLNLDPEFIKHRTNQSNESIRKNFLSRIDMSAGDNACWPYSMKGRGAPHRKAWRYLGMPPIPKGYDLHHTCRRGM